MRLLLGLVVRRVDDAGGPTLVSDDVEGNEGDVNECDNVQYVIQMNQTEHEYIASTNIEECTVKISQLQ